MKTLFKVLLILGTILAARSAEVKWTEKEIYTVSEQQGSKPDLFKVKVATPDPTGFAGFFCEPGPDISKSVRGIRTEGITPGRIDAWEKEEISLPAAYLESALPPKDSSRQSLVLTADPTHRTQEPLCQWGHSLYIMLKSPKSAKVAFKPKEQWTGFKLKSCAPEERGKKLPVLYSRTVDSSRNSNKDFLGMLNTETGDITEVLEARDPDDWSGAQLDWISDHLLAVTRSSRYGESGTVVDLAKKKVIARQYIPGAARWLIDGGQLHVWHAKPGAIPIQPAE